MKRTYKALLGAAVGLAMATTAFAAEITGAGASFPFPIYAKWAAVYKSSSGTSLNYQSIGSGGGIAQIKAKTVAFGATDKPLTPKELAAAGLTQFPTVIGGVVPVINVPGVKPGQVTLDGPHPGRHLPGQGRPLGRAGNQEAEPRRGAAFQGHHRRASFGRLGHHLHLRDLSVTRVAFVEGRCGRGYRD